MSAPFVHGLLLVRHGQSTWNAEQRWQGQADPPLSTLGQRQGAAAGEAVAALGPTRFVASDLVRARTTARLLAPPDAPITLEPGLRERHAGEWTGLTRPEIDERYPGWVEAQRSPPGFEGDDELLARVLPVVESLLGSTDEPGPTLAVTHGGVIRTVERHFGAPATAVPNLGGRWLHADRSGSELVIVLGDREILIDPDAVALTVPDQI